MLGLGNTLTSGGALSTGLANTYSLDFDGTNDQIVVGNDSSLALTNDFTLSAWVYPTSTGGGQRFIDRGTIYYLGWDVVNEKFEFTKFAVANKRVIADDTSDLNTWHHVVGVSSGGGGSGTSNLYVNGVSAADELGSLGNVEVSTASIIIGSHADGAYFTGLIDEVAIWNVVLSAADVSSIYNSGKPNDLTDASSYDADRTGGLIGYWRFEEGSGTSATDSSTNSNTGTLTNGPAYSTSVPS